MSEKIENLLLNGIIIIMGNFASCTQKASTLYASLKGRDKLAEWVVFYGPPTGHCFRIGGFNHDDFDALSIAIPPDAMGNRGVEYDEGEPSTIEAALFKCGELVYVDELGYENIQRFLGISINKFDNEEVFNASPKSTHIPDAANKELIERFQSTYNFMHRRFGESMKEIWERYELLENFRPEYNFRA